MSIRFDKFTLVVLGIVAVLLLAAIFTMARSGAALPAAYRTGDTPDVPVYNAFLALQKGDIPTARQQYSSTVLKQADSDKGYGPLRGEENYMRDTARRLRIIETRLDPQNPDRAYVTYAVDTYSSRGLFNQGSAYTTQRTVELARENGAWKINTEEYFF